jgi:hypothetical protein
MVQTDDMRIPRRGQLGGLRLLRLHSKSLVEARKSDSEHTVSVIDGDRRPRVAAR